MKKRAISLILDFLGTLDLEPEAMASSIVPNLPEGKDLSSFIGDMHEAWGSKNPVPVLKIYIDHLAESPDALQNLLAQYEINKDTQVERLGYLSSLLDAGLIETLCEHIAQEYNEITQGHQVMLFTANRLFSHIDSADALTTRITCLAPVLKGLIDEAKAVAEAKAAKKAKPGFFQRIANDVSQVVDRMVNKDVQKKVQAGAQLVQQLGTYLDANAELTLEKEGFQEGITLAQKVVQHLINHSNESNDGLIKKLGELKEQIDSTSDVPVGLVQQLMGFLGHLLNRLMDMVGLDHSKTSYALRYELIEPLKKLKSIDLAKQEDHQLAVGSLTRVSELHQVYQKSLSHST